MKRFKFGLPSMTTDLAFCLMINQRGIHRELNVRRGTVGKWRNDFKKNPKLISIDKKIALLYRAGWKAYQETRWVKVSTTSSAALNKEIDYLNDFPGLTLIGRLNGMMDETIRRANKTIIEHPERFMKIYKKLA